MVLLRCHPTETPLAIAMTWTCRPQQTWRPQKTQMKVLKQMMRIQGRQWGPFSRFPHTSQAHGMPAEKTIKVWPWTKYCSWQSLTFSLYQKKKPAVHPTIYMGHSKRTACQKNKYNREKQASICDCDTKAFTSFFQVSILWMAWYVTSCNPAHLKQSTEQRLRTTPNSKPQTLNSKTKLWAKMRYTLALTSSYGLPFCTHMFLIVLLSWNCCCSCCSRSCICSKPLALLSRSCSVPNVPR